MRNWERYFMERLTRVSCLPRGRGRGWREWNSLSLVSLLSPPSPRLRLRAGGSGHLPTYCCLLLRLAWWQSQQRRILCGSQCLTASLEASRFWFRRTCCEEETKVQVNLLLCSLHPSGLVVQCCWGRGLESSAIIFFKLKLQTSF